ncbi:sensor histidine kinase [Gloeobacter kilaueensis]|uniref:Oxygen sensor histidine kinase NreB n=1 Tax=Gloeobacter kilaueensis (strain ATCC BAA-2537 / CCAP 1431/1 / ULC 316 / JS1) TaxID=1183438 RepID=U5QKZ5_GLOK1|nr:PAS domain-containing sensor histidine kinase [Gloeobacter kilaueensis]AGY59662.1 histidine kinase [Gloeobacter kilaueensis JS1]
MEQLQQELERLRQENKELQRYRALFEQSPLSMQLHAPDGRFVVANAAHFHQWNITAEQMQHFDPLSDPELERLGILGAVQRAFAGETVLIPGNWYDSSHITPNGTRRYVDAVCFPLRDGAGQISEVVIIHQDMTFLERAELQLLQEREKAAQERAAQLARANGALRESLALLSHQANLDRFLGYVLGAVAEQAGACAVHLYVFDPLANTLSQRLCVRNGEVFQPNHPDDPALFRRPFAADITPAWEQMVRAKNSIIHHTIDQPHPMTWPQTLEWHKKMGHRARIAVPLFAGEQAVGLLGIAMEHEELFAPEQTEFIAALANQAALAVQLDRLATEARQSAVLEERNRLAREIHDTLAQSLTGIVLHLETAAELLSEHPKAVAHILQARELARSGLAEARCSLWALRPRALEGSDLGDALQRLLQQLTAYTAVESRFQSSGTPQSLSAEVEANLLRIAAEALTNALKHAQARILSLELTYKAGAVELWVSDDGCGFDPERASGGLGLAGMRERARRLGGQLLIASGPGAGTRVVASVPLTPASAAESALETARGFS